ncbi:MAG: metalloregulator ArsR/SmtB family transcription factor [Actinomycetota bacterium]|nr:metalloregulator ArsR/SmtB family transcription factor [Actinomycetota bacterium]
MVQDLKVKIFKALSDETRCEMVVKMMGGEVSCDCMAKDFSLSRPALSHHIRVLRESSLIILRKEGQFHHYALNFSFIEEVLPGLIEALKK